MRYLHAQEMSFNAEAGGQLSTALHDAAASGRGERVTCVSACVAAVAIGKSDGAAASHKAVQYASTAATDRLPGSGADIEAKDDHGAAPLMHAMF